MALAGEEGALTGSQLPPKWMC